MSAAVQPEDILQELGGCGKFQVLLSILVHAMKLVVCWSMINMVYSSTAPNWWCLDDLGQDNHTMESIMSHLTNSSRMKACKVGNGTKCSSFLYDTEKTTIVSAFDLVCESAWIPAAIASIQMSGVFVGNIISGHTADGFGRKRPLFFSLLLLCVCNIIGSFSTSWMMFAVLRFIIGVGTGFFLTIQYSLLSEFTLAEWRSWVIGVPSWPIESCLFALVSWALHDWKYLQLTTGLVTVPFLLTWWFVPESFRWYISQDRDKDAAKVVEFVAKVNKHPCPAPELLDNVTVTGSKASEQKLTFIALFRTRYLLKVTCLSLCNWFALGLVGYGIQFGVSSLSGNLYFNLFLFALLSSPSKLLSVVIQNRFGRKKATMLIYSIITAGAISNGVIQYVDTPMRDRLTTGLSLVCFVSINAAWGPVQTTTIEMYPTAIRNIGFGFLSVFARIGSVLGPPFVYASTIIPGLMYFVIGAIAFICVFTTIGLPETKTSNLKDRMTAKTNTSGNASDKSTRDSKDKEAIV